MTNFKQLQTVLTQCESAKNLTAKQMENAMINIDRMAPSFGKSSQEFRTFTVTGENHVLDDVTHQQFADFVAMKQNMLANHSYVLA